MILLQGNQLARHFGSDILFENLHVEIQDASRIALVGRNGAGKSTLLKILASLEAPDAGTLAKSKQLTLGYLAQHSALTSEATIWEEMLKVYAPLQKLEKQMHDLSILLGDETVLADDVRYADTLRTFDQIQEQFQQANGYGYEAEIRTVLAGFHFPEAMFDRSIATLSGGQKTRLSLAKLLLEKPQLLILDEPTNHLDIATLAWLESYLVHYQGALLIVSHDRYFLDKVCNEVYELSRQKLRHYTGNYSTYLEKKAIDEQLAWKAYEKQQTEINKLEDFVQKNIARASTTKRAQSRQKQLARLDRIDRPDGAEKSATILFDVDTPSGNVVLQLEQASIGYTPPALCAPVQLDVRKQDAIAVVGPNGIGKTTLLKSILGRIPFLEGTPQFGTNVQIGYYDQEQTDLHPSKTILQELWDEHPTVPEKDIRTVLGSFLFSGEDVKKTIGLLSGGEKARVLLAKLAMQEKNFLILDEPTNHLDIDSKEVLEQALIDFSGTLLFVSHDRYFINRIATKVIELSPTGSRLYLGDYDYYLEKKAEEAEIARLNALEKPEILTTTVSKGKVNFQKSKEEQKARRQLERQLSQVEDRLAIVESELAKTEQEMSNPALFDDHVALQELQATIDRLQKEQTTLYDDWETVSLALEEEK